MTYKQNCIIYAKVSQIKTMEKRKRITVSQSHAVCVIIYRLLAEGEHPPASNTLRDFMKGYGREDHRRKTIDVCTSAMKLVNAVCVDKRKCLWEVDL